MFFSFFFFIKRKCQHAEHNLGLLQALEFISYLFAVKLEGRSLLFETCVRARRQAQGDAGHCALVNHRCLSSREWDTCTPRASCIRTWSQRTFSTTPTKWWSQISASSGSPGWFRRTGEEVALVGGTSATPPGAPWLDFWLQASGLLVHLCSAAALPHIGCSSTFYSLQPRWFWVILLIVDRVFSFLCRTLSHFQEGEPTEAAARLDLLPGTRDRAQDEPWQQRGQPSVLNLGRRLRLWVGSAHPLALPFTGNQRRYYHQLSNKAVPSPQYGHFGKAWFAVVWFWIKLTVGKSNWFSIITVKGLIWKWIYWVCGLFLLFCVSFVIKSFWFCILPSGLFPQNSLIVINFKT